MTDARIKVKSAFIIVIIVIIIIIITSGVATWDANCGGRTCLNLSADWGSSSLRGSACCQYCHPPEVAFRSRRTTCGTDVSSKSNSWPTWQPAVDAVQPICLKGQQEEDLSVWGRLVYLITRVARSIVRKLVVRLSHPQIRCCLRRMALDDHLSFSFSPSFIPNLILFVRRDRRPRLNRPSYCRCRIMAPNLRVVVEVEVVVVVVVFLFRHH